MPDGTVVYLPDGRIGTFSKGRITQVRHLMEGETVMGKGLDGKTHVGVVRDGRVVPKATTILDGARRSTFGKTRGMGREVDAVLKDMKEQA